mgnify:CR=1 FL=1
MNLFKGRISYFSKASSIIILFFIFLIWEVYVTLGQVPQYILPAPTNVISTLFADWPILFPAMLNTLEIALIGFILASSGGIFIALLMSYSRSVQNTLLPLAIVLQVTPIVAIAPIIIIYVDSTYIALMICVWLVAFFPILTNTLFGLNTVNPELTDLFRLYRASKIRTLLHLKIPNSIPSVIAGLKVSAGLSLIGAIVAEFAAGAGGSSSGLAFRILEAGYRLNISRMFACLLLLAIIGILFHKLIEIAAQKILWRYN